MTRKERDNRKTDRAWENVYQRLEKDGLLDHKEKSSIILMETCAVLHSGKLFRQQQQC
ncbi:hypothetical protein [Parabacteroides sp. AM58-2XD]|uniref:hypothetical protein n=1 Tax=Parabacteroides sp. AM58-2XD TaxID=2292362 RepID=UPI001F477F5D|nr:hypothetical protein [Parabacteroides sp. AM58-2XD]